MKKKKSLNFILNLEIYPFDIMFSFNENDEEIEKNLKRWNLTDMDLEYVKYTRSTTNGRYILLSTNASVIRMRDIPKTPYQYSVLQHEIFHAVTYILDLIGMELIIGKSDEAYSYLLGHITEKVYERLNTIK